MKLHHLLEDVIEKIEVQEDAHAEVVRQAAVEVGVEVAVKVEARVEVGHHHRGDEEGVQRDQKAEHHRLEQTSPNSAHVVEAYHRKALCKLDEVLVLSK